jgi:hypothetical protein
MAKLTDKSRISDRSRTLGGRAFAAITAVEGLKLSASGKERLKKLAAEKLLPDQRRAEVVRAYMDLSKRNGA